jgi:hypothetical protein
MALVFATIVLLLLGVSAHAESRTVLSGNEVLLKCDYTKHTSCRVAQAGGDRTVESQSKTEASERPGNAGPIAIAASPKDAISPDALYVVNFFKYVFTVVLALALGEAFKQFVADAAAPDARSMHWDRLPTLILFLVTIFPFFQGMSRHFDANYQHAENLLKLYPNYLFVDGVAFTIESALFFVLSRALAPQQLERVIVTLLALFAVDLGRDIISFAGPGSIGPWTYQSVVTVIILLAILFWQRLSWLKTPNWLAAFAVIRTILDYYLTWTFYFPPAKL